MNNSIEKENAGLGPAISEKDAKRNMEKITPIVTDNPQFFKLYSVFDKHNNPIHSGPGVYGVKDENDNLIYVGMSENLSSRWYKHTHPPARNRNFDSPFSKTIYESLPVSLFWQVCAVPLNLSREELLKVEEQLIKEFSPLHNRAHYRKSWDTPTKVQELF